MIRAGLLSVMVFASAAWADADSAYQDAKEAYQKLKSDPKRRAFRHHWQNVARKFDAVATRFPRSDRAPEALYNSGELYNELSRFSAKDEDLSSAVRAYRKLIDGFPKHKLADDAALALARVLANQDGDVAGARKVLEAAVKNAGDKRKDLAAMLAALPREARAEPALKGAFARAADAAPSPEDAAGDLSSKGRGKAPADAADAAAEPRDEQAGKKAAAPSSKPQLAEADEARSKKASAKEGAEAGAGRGKKSDPKLEARSKADEAPAADEGRGKAAIAKKLDDPKSAEQPIDVAEAIRRAIKPLEGMAREGEGPLTAQARRIAPARPSDDRDERSADDVDEGDEPMVTSLAERLRDVRVGAKKVDESEARSRLKQLAKADAGSELTLAQQLGLKVRRVIIDAGHGGHDTGAIGAKGTREKDVALAIAKKLARQLEAAGLEVIMTRDDDTFVRLEDRTRFANRQKGDLFISIHCNSAPTKGLRGIETYTLNTSSNRYSIRLAARENATTERGVGDLQYILADLATKANTGESTQLAERVQRSLVRDLSSSYKGVKDLGNKEALFFVLLGARMPAILVETSFLSHPEEEERLADEEYQQKIADSIAESVTGFLEDRNKLAQVD